MKPSGYVHVTRRLLLLLLLLAYVYPYLKLILKLNETIGVSLVNHFLKVVVLHSACLLIEL